MGSRYVGKEQFSFVQHTSPIENTSSTGFIDLTFRYQFSLASDFTHTWLRTIFNLLLLFTLVQYRSILVKFCLLLPSTDSEKTVCFSHSKADSLTVSTVSKKSIVKSNQVKSSNVLTGRGNKEVRSEKHQIIVKFINYLPRRWRRVYGNGLFQTPKMRV